MTRAANLSVLLLGLALAPGANAAVTPEALARVGVRPPANARLPLALVFTDQDGRATTLRQALDGKPGVVVFEDYRCNTLCGPALSIAAAALDRAGLPPGRAYRLVAIGLDPREGPGDASRMRATRLAAQPALREASSFLTGSDESVRAATEALGFNYAQDPQSGEFTHPVAAFVTTPDGRLSRILSEINLTGPLIGEALKAADQGVLGGLSDPLGLLCHGVAVALGRFDAPVALALRVGGAATLAAMGGGLAALVLRRKRLA